MFTVHLGPPAGSPRGRPRATCIGTKACMYVWPMEWRSDWLLAPPSGARDKDKDEDEDEDEACPKTTQNPILLPLCFRGDHGRFLCALSLAAVLLSLFKHLTAPRASLVWVTMLIN